MIILFGGFLVGLLFYSYVLVDPNLTFVSHPLWVFFRERVIAIGYFQRETSWYIYVTLLLLAFIFHLFFIKRAKKITPFYIAVIVGVVLLASYPLLSHDFFNYLFDAKIFTYYHQNPYLHKALDFPRDPWLRFLQWTHRSYPYGPIFLIISLVPSFLSFGKFALAFLFFKATNIFFYLIAVHSLQKMNRKWAMIFATHPLILIEGLVNGHNDMIALSLAIIGIYYVMNKRAVWSRILLLFSGGIKYITLPIIFITRSRKLTNTLIFILQIGIIVYLSVQSEIQPWYFLGLFAYIPFFEDFLSRLNLFFAGLFFSYYPYIRLGGWDSFEKVNLKHIIIFIFLILNLLYLSLIYLKPLKKKFFKR